MVVMDKIDHVTIVVKDLEKSETFYKKGFGLEVIREWERKEIGLKSRLLGSKKNDTLIELWKWDMPAEEQNKNEREIGINHIAFQVENVEKKIKELKKLGAKTIQNVQKGITVETFALVEDINGITIELLEMKK